MPKVFPGGARGCPGDAQEMPGDARGCPRCPQGVPRGYPGDARSPGGQPKMLGTKLGASSGVWGQMGAPRGAVGGMGLGGTGRMEGPRLRVTAVPRYSPFGTAEVLAPPNVFTPDKRGLGSAGVRGWPWGPAHPHPPARAPAQRPLLGGGWVLGRGRAGSLTPRLRQLRRGGGGSASAAGAAAPRPGSEARAGFGGDTWRRSLT